MRHGMNGYKTFVLSFISLKFILTHFQLAAPIWLYDHDLGGYKG